MKILSMKSISIVMNIGILVSIITLVVWMIVSGIAGLIIWTITFPLICNIIVIMGEIFYSIL
ncbi:MAG: hypothetical protein KAH32_00930 [Chlamydiia bacterium]|nr:hypothetical protein [Chlamydiia bacterium]